MALSGGTTGEVLALLTVTETYEIDTEQAGYPIEMRCAGPLGTAAMGRFPPALSNLAERSQHRRRERSRPPAPPVRP